MNKEERKLVDAYVDVFTCASGEVVLADLAEACFDNETSFCPGDPYRSAAQEGRRSVLLKIRRILAKGTK